MIKNVVFDIYDVLISFMDGPIHGSVDLLMELKSRGVPLYAVTNMTTEGFQETRREYPFLRLFDGVVVSGSVGLYKPDPQIFTHLLTQFNLDPRETLFIDDKASNVQGAIEAGLTAIRFENPRQLEQALESHNILSYDGIEDAHGCGCGGGGCGCGCSSNNSGGGCGCH